MKKGLKSYTQKPGFSLVEMLMALLVASLLLAALAPVMTRKFADNVNINANNTTQSKGWRLYTYAPDCEKEEGNDNVCVFNDFKIPKGVYALNLIMVSGGGGGAGSTAETLSATETVTKTADGIKTDTKEYDEQIIPITEYMTNIKLESLIGAGGGGGGGAAGYKKFEPSEANCKNYGTDKTDTVGNTGTNFAVYDSVNKICVTKFNQKVGDNGASGCLIANSNGCSATNNANDMPYSYSGCNRWTCTYTAAETACSNLAASTKDDWKLPTSTQIFNWSSVSIWKTLNLCDGNNNKYIPFCNYDTSNAHVPHAHHGVNSHMWIDINTVRYKYTTAKTSGTASTRCVLNQVNLLSPYIGSTGGAGSSLSNIDLTQYVKQAGYDGRIVLRAARPGNGGNGAPGKNTSASEGKEGYRSCIYVQKKNGTSTVYALCAYGGKAGNGATADTSTGANGAGLDPYSYCREYINNAWRDISCNAVTSGDYGKGGAGGSAQWVDDIITTSPGLAGTGGVVKLTYQNEFAGSGGGGGAGGMFAKLTNLSLDADTECTIKVGGGGSYGSGQDGKSGGDTSIKCGNSKEYIVYGSGGGKLGTSGVDMANPKPMGGKGGAAGKVSENIKQLGTLAEIAYGEENAATAAPETMLKINGNLNVGGNGGKSGTGAIGGCGGLRPNDDPDCTNPNSNATLAEYVTPVYTSLIADTPDYGKAGAGGGGGGWSKTLSPKQGTGSSGQPGFLFLWWNQD